MTDHAARVLEAALRLPPEVRAAMAATLIDSLDDVVDEGVEKAWSEELARRIREIDDGLVDCVPWEEARRRIVGDSE